MADRPTARRRARQRDERRGTLLDSLPRTPAAPPSASGSRRAPDERASRSGEFTAPRHLGLPSVPRLPVARYNRAEHPALSGPRDWDDIEAYNDIPDDDDPYPNEYTEARDAGYPDARDGYMDDDYAGEPVYTTRSRERSLARPLAPTQPPFYNDSGDLALTAYPPLPIDSAPELAAFRPAPAQRRARLDTRALAEAARSPWTIARLALALTAVLLALLSAAGQMGERSQPLMIAHAQAGLAPGGAVTDLIQPETQLMRPDLYDSYAQFQTWGGAACSAAALSEILTAYGVPHATIGHEIDELGSSISPSGGLLDLHGFAVVAAMHNLRADESTSLTYNQIVYLSQQLGMPVIVNVRISYGYYHFFDGGHFLTVVGGDAQGLKVVDSSEYYLHYLPKDVFYQMFTGYTAAIVPADYQYSLPAN